jgi:glycosyltransferase involved in cell wall biosynthesis
MTGSDRSTLFLWTPVPPARTGTADYVPILLQEAPAGLFERFRLRFVVDSAANHAIKHFQDHAVIGPEAAVPNCHDHTIFFLANNEYHRYCFRGLMTPRPGVVISLVHDLSCAMNVIGMCHAREHGFSPDDLPGFVVGELGPHRARLIREVVGQGAPHFLRTSIMAQTPMLLASDHIIVHSHYARLRLLLETRPGFPVPPISVMDHPTDQATTVLDEAAPSLFRQSSSRFIVGLFGWVSAAKRIIPVIEAFASFLRQLTEDEQSKTLLRITGHLHPLRNHDPAGAAMRAGIAQRVAFLGYVPQPELERLMSETHLVFNLRFPSCGESSGTFKRARHLGVPVAITRYGAFNEERADFYCSCEPSREPSDILAAIQAAYEEWQRHGNTARLVARDARRVPAHESAHSVLSRLLL